MTHSKPVKTLKGQAANEQDFAKLVGFKSKKNLLYVLYGLDKDKKYKSFKIAKKSGGSRIIQAPVDILKRPQKQLSNILYKFANDPDVDIQNTVAHGFQKSYLISGQNKKKRVKKMLNIYTHAKNHKNKRWVFNFDIQDFFATINFGRVRGFFEKNKNFKLNRDVATRVAQLSCYDNQLPQGSPCSPVISNLIASYLDYKLLSLAKQYKLTYSRYADDITFSTNRPRFPAAVACQIENSNKYKAGPRLQKIISKCGFKINPSKTRMQFRASRQTVTGLIVNQKVNIKNEYYKACRAMCHSLFTKGEFHVKNKKFQLGNDKKSLHEGLKVLEGMLNYIFYIKIISPLQQTSSFKELATLLRSTPQQKKSTAAIKWRPIENISDANVAEKIHQKEGVGQLIYDFLVFKFFIIPQRPVVVCEGKTDVVYLQCAMKKLYKNQNKCQFISSFPRQMLGIKDGSGLTDFIDKYKGETIGAWRKKYPCQACKNVLTISAAASKVLGMGAALESKSATSITAEDSIDSNSRSHSCRPQTIGAYNHLPRVCRISPEQPLIVLMDNDSGVEGVFKWMRKKVVDEGAKIHGFQSDQTFGQFIQCDKSPFFHIAHNLYLVKTPSKNKSCSLECKCECTSNSNKKKPKHKGQSVIENFFDHQWLTSLKLNGKKFKIESKSKNKNQIRCKCKCSDKSKWFGKSRLASHVSRNLNKKNKGSKNSSDYINFEDFWPLLKRFEAVTEHYNNRVRART